MVNNQTEFNNKYPKEVKEIKLKNKEFAGQLVIEGYSNLGKLYLRNVKNIDKVILRNLTQLQECTISDCGVQELVIENCLQVKELNVPDNSLTNLEFLINLENLEELELKRNTELIEILKPYGNDWKTYQKDLQEIFELTKQNNFRGLVKKIWDLKKSREDLKKDVSVFLSKETQQKVTSRLINTKELILNLGKELSEAKVRAEEREKEIERISELEAVNESPIYKEAINLLRTKLVFLNARRGTIEELKKRCNELEEFLNNKNAKFAIIGNTISNAGGAAGATTPFGLIPKSLGEVIKASNEYSKIKFLAKSSEEFQVLLKNEDELIELDRFYDFLIGISDINILNLKDKQVYGKKHLFNIDCEILAILESKGIWEGRLLDSETMGTAIMSLSENLKELEEEWNQQFNEFKNKLKFEKEYTKLFIQEREIRKQIRQLQSQLDKSINSAKGRLESKKWWDISEEKEKRTKGRQLLLETFFNDQASLTSSDKELLERKLSKEGLDNLYQTKTELVQLQTELDNLLKQEQHYQSHIQIPPKSNN